MKYFGILRTHYDGDYDLDGRLFDSLNDTIEELTYLAEDVYADCQMYFTPNVEVFHFPETKYAFRNEDGKLLEKIEVIIINTYEEEE